MSETLFRPLTPDDIDEWVSYLRRNRSSFQRFEPIRDNIYYTYDAQFHWLNQIQLEEDEIHYGLFSNEGKILGKISLTNIFGGIFQNANVGYTVDAEEHKKGYGTLMLTKAIYEAFFVHKLHRIQAAIMPTNEPSKALIKKMGFREEGLAKRYFLINGKWEDHLLFALTKEEMLVNYAF